MTKLLSLILPLIILFIHLTLVISYQNNDHSTIIIELRYNLFIEIVEREINPNIIASILNKTLSRTYNVEGIRIEELGYKTYSIKATIKNWNRRYFYWNISELTIYLKKPIKVIVKWDKCYNVEVHPKSLFFVYETKNKLVIRVKVSLNYNALILGLSILLVPSLIIAPLVLLYVKKSVRELRGKDYYTISGKLRSISTITALLLIIPPVVSLILSLILTDFPVILSIILNMPLEVGLIVVLSIFFLLFIVPLAYSIKYTAPLYGKEKVEKREYIYAIGYFAPLILGIVMIFVIVTNVPKPLLQLIESLPKELRVAPWFILGCVLSYLLFMIIDKIITSRLEKPIEPWVANLVHQVVKQLGVKSFKRIRKVRTIGGKIANALVKGMISRELILTERLIEILEPDELKAVIAHEIAHHKYRHIELLTLVWIGTGLIIFSIFAQVMEYIEKTFRYRMIEVWDILGLLIFLSLFITSFITLILITRFVSRRAEEKADYEVLRVVDDPKIFIRALTKIVVVDMLPMEMSKLLEKFETHPAPIKRILKVAKRYNISEQEVRQILDQVVKELSH